MCILNIIYVNEFACKTFNVLKAPTPMQKQKQKNTHIKDKWFLYQDSITALSFLLRLSRIPKYDRLDHKSKAKFLNLVSFDIRTSSPFTAAAG